MRDESNTEMTRRKTDDVRIKIEQVKVRISHSPNRGIIETGGCASSVQVV